MHTTLVVEVSIADGDFWTSLKSTSLGNCRISVFQHPTFSSFNCMKVLKKFLSLTQLFRPK